MTPYANQTTPSSQVRPHHASVEEVPVMIVPDGTEERHETGESILRQPKAVWAVAFACTVAFMGIGLVDPILPAISEKLHATPSQAMWLFTSYLFITGIAMFFT